MKKITTSTLAKVAQARALALLVRNGGTVSIYGNKRAGADDDASQLELLVKAAVEKCDLDGLTLRLKLAVTRVVQDGAPKWFRVASGTGEGLWDGYTGMKKEDPKDDPDLITPSETFVRGAKVEFDVFEHKLVFVE